MLTRIKTFLADGSSPFGRLFAGDLNALQDAVAAINDLTQTLGVGALSLGESGLQFVRYGAGEARLSGALRTDGIIRGLGGLFAPAFSTTARDAIPAGFRPFTLLIFNTTTNQFEWNAGSDAVPSWQALSAGIGAGSVMLAMLAANSVDGSKIVDGSVAAAEIAGALKPSVSASAATEALRALGTTAATAAAGNDARLSDQRTPPNGSVTFAKLSFLPVFSDDETPRIERGRVATVGTGFPYPVAFAHAFASAPDVFLASDDGAAPIVRPASITTAGFNISGAAWFDFSGSAGNVSWLAIGV